MISMATNPMALQEAVEGPSGEHPEMPDDLGSRPTVMTRRLTSVKRGWTPKAKERPVVPSGQIRCGEK